MWIAADNVVSHEWLALYFLALTVKILRDTSGLQLQDDIDAGNVIPFHKN